MTQPPHPLYTEKGPPYTTATPHLTSTIISYEKVLEVFREYLEEDRFCEPVSTSQGYIVMLWDSCLGRWYDFEDAPTPEALQDVLLKNFKDYHMDQKSDPGERDGPTEQERQQIEAMCRVLLERCQTCYSPQSGLGA